MNSLSPDQLKNILTPFLDLESLISLPVEDITSNLQEAGKKHVVFYNIGETKEDEVLFHKRLKNSSFGLLIVNRIPSFLKGFKNVLQIGKSKFLPIQKILLDILFPLKKQPLLAGITGTNGKTTVSFLAVQIAVMSNKKALCVGTLGVLDHFGVCLHSNQTTTPSYIDMRKIIHRFSSMDVLFLELSSHSLDQNRIFDLKLDIAAWTNLSQDHLDYHKDMDSYFRSKLQIKRHLKNNLLIIPSCEKELEKKIKSVATILKTKSLQDYSYFNIPNIFNNHLQKTNLEISLMLNKQLWGSLPKMNLKNLRLPKGRFHIIESNSGPVVIDYAHTPDAMKSLLLDIKSYFPTLKSSIVFGCGGNRDFLKRSIMGSIACRYADSIYITSDNPRDESPQKIMKDIKKGCRRKKVHLIEDRREAIETALANRSGKDVIVIAGKGHESYQEIRGKKNYFSDFDEVARYKERIEK